MLRYVTLLQHVNEGLAGNSIAFGVAEVREILDGKYNWLTVSILELAVQTSGVRSFHLITQVNENWADFSPLVACQRKKQVLQSYVIFKCISRFHLSMGNLICKKQSVISFLFWTAHEICIFICTDYFHVYNFFCFLTTTL